MLKKVSFGLIGVLIFVLAAATILEPLKGSSFVSKYVYSSIPFVVIWTLTAIVGLTYMIKLKLYKKTISFLLHLAFLIILSGAFITWISGSTGYVHLREGKAISTYKDDSNKTKEFPFTVNLTGFAINYYPGTQTPQDFKSKIQIKSLQGSILSEGAVSMNQIFTYKGFRFCQAGYDDDLKGTSLSISHDFYGVAVSYSGYLILLISMVLFILSKQTDFRKLLHHPLLKGMTIFLLLLSCSGNMRAENKKHAPKVLPKEVAGQFCDLLVYYNGRICPLQTLAKDFTVKLYGKSSYNGYSAEQVFTGWVFYYSSWKKQAVIKIKSKKVRDILGIEDKYACYLDFIDKENQYKLNTALKNLYKGKEVSNKKGLRAADEKFNIIQMLYNGEMTKIFPYQDSKNTLHWFATNSSLPQELDKDNWIFIRRSMDFLREMVIKKDYKNFIQLTQKIKEYQVKKAGKNAPSKFLFQAEKIYNALNYLKLVAILFICFGFFAFILYIRAMISNKQLNSKITILLNLILLSGMIYLTANIILRGIVSQHFPVTNGYETMQFLAWCTLLLTVLLQRRFHLFLPYGFFIGGLALMVSFLGQNNPQITPLMPVLSSPLLSVHVVSIMISYSLFAFMMLNGITGVIIHYFSQNEAKQIQQLHIVSQILLYPAVFLLVTGTFIGAVWANVSWGRYWGWDPKEVWALITILIYSFPLHAKSISRFRDPFFFHCFTIIAFLSVLFTYFGVNYILGGMHSYAG